MQGFMPPDAFMFDTSGQLVMQTAIGGIGTLFGPLLGAGVWLFLQDFLQATLKLGATWKLVLGLVFVLLVFFLRHGLIGGIRALYGLAGGKPAPAAAKDEAPVPDEAPDAPPGAVAQPAAPVTPGAAPRRAQLQRPHPADAAA